ncbi:hypothetical protein WR25_14632 [Diploscapter pachys]|uniref:Uncharacterized protein n=1 Tax=Diploscapter pachys TaxID=2018661 RepID=A0A2A2LF45_9BILA|nr:hypothetical protein WR25_14632 [Diploscapter pachys]
MQALFQVCSLSLDSNEIETEEEDKENIDIDMPESSSNNPTNFYTLDGGERISSAFANLSFSEDAKHDKRATESMALFRKRFKLDKVVAPSSEFNQLPASEVSTSKKFSVPKELIRYKAKKSEEYESLIEYDCDEEDCRWLKRANELRKKENKSQLDETAIEFIIDRLEKDSKFEVKGNPTMAGMDVDDVCCVCGDGDVSNANQIIYCDMCNIAVHQECYGVPYIPEGQWLCRRCKFSPSAPVQCCLCPNTSGAFKQTSDGRWAHVVCAIWLNEVHFANAVFLEPVEGVDHSLRRRAKLKCLVCRKKVGACLQCSTRSCTKAFHVTCAQQSGMAMKVITKHDSDANDQMNVQRFVYCHLHADDDDEAGEKSKKKRMQDAIRSARRNMAAKTRDKPAINMPTISEECVAKIEELAKTDISDVVLYWYMKRKIRCGVPLIKRLMITQKMSRTTAPTFEMDEEDREVCEAFQKRRFSLETARLLSEQVKKREIHKRAFFSTSHHLFEVALSPPTAILESALKRLCHKDKLQVFANPVDIEGYRDIIKHPMDLSAIKEKLKSNKYGKVADLRADIELMLNNCDKFNADNDYYFDYGQKFRGQAEKILAEAEEKEKEQLAIFERDSEFINELSSPILPYAIEEDVQATDSKDIKTSVKENQPTPPPSAAAKSHLTPNKYFPIFMPQKRKSSQPAPDNAKKKKKNNHGKASTQNTSIATPMTGATAVSRRSTTGGALSAASSRATPLATPLLAFRDNSMIRSPLPADPASSESSTEDDERPSRRTTRQHTAQQIQEASDSEGFQHGDLVVINNSFVGRICDPVNGRLEKDLPIDIFRRNNSKSPQLPIQLCKKGYENKIEWHSYSEVRLFDPKRDNNLSHAKEAKMWQKSIISAYGKK